MIGAGRRGAERPALRERRRRRLRLGLKLTQLVLGLSAVLAIFAGLPLLASLLVAALYAAMVFCYRRDRDL
jgi:hypothetical protein